MLARSCPGQDIKRPLGRPTVGRRHPLTSKSEKHLSSADPRGSRSATRPAGVHRHSELADVQRLVDSDRVNRICNHGHHDGIHVLPIWAPAMHRTRFLFLGVSHIVLRSICLLADPADYDHGVNRRVRIAGVVSPQGATVCTGVLRAPF
jgi:hypothetical protein